MPNLLRVTLKAAITSHDSTGRQKEVNKAGRSTPSPILDPSSSLMGAAYSILGSHFCAAGEPADFGAAIPDLVLFRYCTVKLASLVDTMCSVVFQFKWKSPPSTKELYCFLTWCGALHKQLQPSRLQSCCSILKYVSRSNLRASAVSGP